MSSRCSCLCLSLCFFFLFSSMIWESIWSDAHPPFHLLHFMLLSLFLSPEERTSCSSPAREESFFLSSLEKVTRERRVTFLSCSSCCSFVFSSSLLLLPVRRTLFFSSLSSFRLPPSHLFMHLFIQP